MIDICEFLLARFAEEKAWVLGEGGSWLEDCQECAFGKQPQSPYSRARFLIGLEGERRMVLHLQKLLEPGEPDISPEYDDGYIDATEYALKLLALGYSDHPDYHEGWRP